MNTPSATIVVSRTTNRRTRIGEHRGVHGMSLNAYTTTPQDHTRCSTSSSRCVPSSSTRRRRRTAPPPPPTVYRVHTAHARGAANAETYLPQYGLLKRGRQRGHTRMSSYAIRRYIFARELTHRGLLTIPYTVRPVNILFITQWCNAIRSLQDELKIGN